MKREPGVLFLLLALMALLAGVLFGSIAALQFVWPEFLTYIPFIRSRPLHVSLVVAWIFLSAAGGIYYYLPRYCGLPLFSSKMVMLHFLLFIITGTLITACLLAGRFGGREYWEFPPALAIPIVISWILFGINFFRTSGTKKGRWPVYFWMWGTGICFFLFTFLESYLWVIPYFRENVVRDLTVQWKAYGALVGSWNMLVYGTAIFLMERIKGNTDMATSRLSFLMYLLGLTNLMFGWAHHIYIVPTLPWIRHLSYAISMTELIILFRIIRNWKNSLSEAKKDFHFWPYRFLVASDIWILLNLILALLISVPAINIYTHGTHITVAHAMGSSIGINTMILLSSVLFIVSDLSGIKQPAPPTLLARTGFWMANGALVLFWVSLIAAGIIKGLMITGGSAFPEVMQALGPWLWVFTFAGLGLFTGLLIIALPAVRMLVQYLVKEQTMS